MLSPYLPKFCVKLLFRVSWPSNSRYALSLCVLFLFGVALSPCSKEVVILGLSLDSFLPFPPFLMLDAGGPAFCIVVLHLLGNFHPPRPPPH